MNYIDKCTGLVKKARNPGYFIYQLFHYLNKHVPPLIAKTIQNANAKEMDCEDIVFLTYDYSNQICHPDMTIFDNKLWMAFTPYPYGMEEYENPTVIWGEKIEELYTMRRNPIDKPEKQKYGHHLSDPCLCEDLYGMCCYYRESIRSRNETNTNSLLYSRYNRETNRWSSPIKICSSNHSDFLSPAFLCIESVIHCFYAESNSKTGNLYHAKLDNNVLSTGEAVEVIGLPLDYFIWHLTIVRSISMNKCGGDNESLLGLFLIRAHSDQSNFRLFYAECQNPDMNWTICSEVGIPDTIKKKAKIIYKSCFVPKTNSILVSYRDKKDRYRIEMIGKEAEHERS